MTVGEIPFETSTSAAAMPAGPAPTITTSAISLQPGRWFGQNCHSVGDGRGARPEAGPILEPHPAVLARAHETEPGTWLAACFVRIQARSRHQDGREYGPSGRARRRSAVDGEMEQRTTRAHGRDEQRVFRSRAIFIRSHLECCSLPPGFEPNRNCTCIPAQSRL